MISPDIFANNNNPNNKNKKEQLILNICYDMERGKLILSDNYNNHYFCDLFCRIKTKFLPNVTGQASFTQRQNFLSKNKKAQTQSNWHINRPNTSKPLILGKKGPVDYLPTTRRFEGYSKFPRPLSPPFSNIPDYQMKDEIKSDLISNLEKYFSDKNTKNKILNKNVNAGLSYMTSDLNEFDCMKVDNEKILDLIKKTLDAIKDKYSLKMKSLNKLPMYKALTQFSQFLMANKDTTIINNRQLSKPNMEIKKRYNYIQSSISRHGLKIGNPFKNKKKLILSNNNNNMNAKRAINSRNNSIDPFNKKINNFIDDDVSKTSFNDLTIGKKIYMDFGTFSYEEEAKKQKANNNIAFTQENNLYSINKEITEATKSTESNYLEKNEKRNRTLNNKSIKSNLSFISKMSENEKKYERENKRHIKGLNYILKHLNRENKLLKGYQMEERKGFIHLYKNLKPKYKNNGELYDEDMALLRKTNPIAFRLQQKKDEFDLKQLIKKVNTQKINADNVMKGKKLKIAKTMETDE
jgi:hypothetical protein